MLCIASNGRMIYVRWIAKDWEGSVRGLVDILSQNLPGETNKHHDNLSQDVQFPGRVSNWASSEYKVTALPPDQSASCMLIARPACFVYAQCQTSLLRLCSPKDHHPSCMLMWCSWTVFIWVMARSAAKSWSQTLEFQWMIILSGPSE
jgi:hypothetical protein